MRPRTRALRLAAGAGLWGLLLGTVVAPGVLAPLPIPLVAAGCTPGLALNVSTDRGPAPLLVSFAVSDVWGPPSSVNWSFGDGQYFNGSGNAYLAPTHLYSVRGDFGARVVLGRGNQSGTCLTTISVSPSPLGVRIGAEPPSGAVPLTVRFTAAVSGGSGTFESAVWTFGDGNTATGFNVSYTYQHAGQFTATFTLVDSANQTVRNSTVVQANASNLPNNTSTRPSAASDPPVLLGLLAAGGVLVGAFFGWGWARRRARATPIDEEGPAGQTPEPGPDGPASSGGPALTPPVPATEPWSSGSSISGGAAIIPVPAHTGPGVDLPLAASASEVSAPAAPSEVEVPGPAPSEPPRLKLSQRVLLHIYLQGHLADGEVAPPGFTQGGMADALAVAQSPLSSVLRRLVVAGIVTQDTRHVRGEARRLRVYRLTPLGETLAKDLYRRKEPHPGSSETGGERSLRYDSMRSNRPGSDTDAG